MVDAGAVGFRNSSDFFAPSSPEETRRQRLVAGMVLAATGAGTVLLATRMGNLRRTLGMLGAAGLMVANGGVMVARGLGGR